MDKHLTVSELKDSVNFCKLDELMPNADLWQKETIVFLVHSSKSKVMILILSKFDEIMGFSPLKLIILTHLLNFSSD